MSLKNALDFQQKNKKYLQDNNINYDKYSQIPIDPRKFFFITKKEFNKKYDIGVSSLEYNPVVNPDDVNEKNRVDRMLDFVKSNLNRDYRDNHQQFYSNQK